MAFLNPYSIRSNHLKERKPYARHVKGKLLGWYLLWEGKQIWLGRFEQEAMENWKRLKAGEEIIRPGRVTLAQSGEPTERQIAEIYLDYQQLNGAEGTYL